MFFQKKQLTESEAAHQRRLAVFNDQIDLSDEAWPDEEPMGHPPVTGQVAKGVFFGGLGAVIAYKSFSFPRLIMLVALFWPFMLGMLLFHTNCREETFTRTQMIIWGIYVQLLLSPVMLFKLMQWLN